MRAFTSEGGGVTAPNVIPLRPREIETIGSTLIGLAREGLPEAEARRRLLACGMSETGVTALIESAARNLKVTA